MLGRRSFLGAAGAIATSLALSACDGGTGHAVLPVFDLHCDTADRIAWQAMPESLRTSFGGSRCFDDADEEDPSAYTELARGGSHATLEKIGDTPWTQCFACFISDKMGPEVAATFHEHVTSYFDEQVAANADRIEVVRTVSEARAAYEAGRVAAFRTIENGKMFAHDVGLVERYAEEGVIMASLSWNSEGPLASGYESHAALTDLGVQALAEMERVGMVFDVSHLNDEGFADVLARSTQPLVATHSNSRAVCDHPRNLTDDQFRAIVDRGGVVGLAYYAAFIAEDASDVTFDQVAAHIEHWLDLGGEDAVALGSDFDGGDMPPLLSGADKVPALQGLLLERFGESVTRKLCSENALSFFERVGH